MEPNKDHNLVSYGAVLAKRQRLMAEPKGVPPPQGVSAPEPIRQGTISKIIIPIRFYSFADI